MTEFSAFNWSQVGSIKTKLLKKTKKDVFLPHRLDIGSRWKQLQLKTPKKRMLREKWRCIAGCGTTFNWNGGSSSQACLALRFLRYELEKKSGLGSSVIVGLNIWQMRSLLWSSFLLQYSSTLSVHSAQWYKQSYTYDMSNIYTGGGGRGCSNTIAENWLFSSFATQYCWLEKFWISFELQKLSIVTNSFVQKVACMLCHAFDTFCQLQKCRAC